MTSPIPPSVGPDIFDWARTFSTWTRRALTQLVFKPSGAAAVENGTLLWDEAEGYPVVSKNGEWRQIVLEDGHANFIKTADVTAASANTAYKLTYDAPVGNEGITQGTPASRIVFEEGGEYVLSFSAQISSTSSSTVHFYFWPSVNGIAATNGAMTTALHQNNATLVVSRTQIFEVSAGDYLEVNFMVDSTQGFLSHTAAASPVPGIPSSTLSITRLHG